MDKYSEEKRLNGNDETDVLTYGKTNHYRYPQSRIHGQNVLSIPILTVAFEPTFSIGGRVFDQYRSSLVHNVVENLICTRDWKFNGQDACGILVEDIKEAILEEDSVQGSNPSIR